MRSPENLSGGKDANIHAAISHPLPTPGFRGTRSVPAELKPAPDKKGNHKLRNIALVASAPAIAAVISGVAAGQHHFEKDEPISLPGITRDIQAIPGQVADWFTSRSEAPLTFDIEYDVKRIQGNETSLTLANILTMSAKDIEKTSQPIKAPQESDLINYPTPLNTTVNRYLSSIPILEIPIPFELTPEERVRVRYVFSTKNASPNYYMEFYDLPNDKQMNAPRSGKYSFSQTRNSAGVFTTASIEFKDTLGNVRYLIFDLGESESLLPEDKAPKTPQGNYSWQQTTEVDAGDPLFKGGGKW